MSCCNKCLSLIFLTFGFQLKAKFAFPSLNLIFVGVPIHPSTDGCDDNGAGDTGNCDYCYGVHVNAVYVYPEFAGG